MTRRIPRLARWIPPAPVGPQFPLSGLQFAGDVFPYADTAALLANCTAGNPPPSVLYTGCVDLQNLSLDPTVQFDGHSTMRFKYNGAIFPNQPQLQVAFAHNGGGASLSAVWFRSTLKFAVGFDDFGSGIGGSPSNKYFAGGWSAYDNSLRCEDPTLAILMRATSGASVVINTVLALTGDVTTSLYLGLNWYDLVFCFDYPTPGNARFRHWRGITGTTPILVGTITGPVLGGFPPPELARWYIQLNFNRQRGGEPEQSYNCGRWELVNGLLHPNPFAIAGA